MLPKFSMAASCLTMTFRRAIRTAPLASVTETIMGSSSGVRPTASATEKRKDSSRSRRSSALTRKAKSTRNITTWRMRKPKRRVPRSNSVSGGRPTRAAATRPNSVDRPVHTTRAVPKPLTTEVPRNTALTALPRSAAPCPSGSACFSRGSDSPVSAASFTKRSFADSNRASAGTRSPALSWTTSPGTTSRTGRSQTAPSRSTSAVCPTCWRRRSAACWERYASVKLSATLSASMSAMITALATWPNAAETALATTRIRTSGLAK
jgi:hypothetical protein